MEYTKPSLTYEEQANVLISRGLLADRDVLIATLQNVNYYRLSGYLYPFRSADDSFLDGTTLDIVWRRYRLDRHLRFLLLDAIERVEVALRSRLVYHFVHKHNAFAYLDKIYLPNLDQTQYDEFKQKLARDLGVPDVVLFSWSLTLNNLRNLCAHHGRGYNKSFKIKLPTNQNKYPDWFNPFSIADKKLFTVLTVLKYLLSHVASRSQWHIRLKGLIEEYSDIHVSIMGFPANWKECLFWKDVDVDGNKQ